MVHYILKLESSLLAAKLEMVCQMEKDLFTITLEIK